MHLALTRCPDELIRRLASSLPEGEVRLSFLPPGDAWPGGAGSDPVDAILTAAPPEGASDHVRWLRTRYGGIPILVVTGSDDPEAVVKAFDAGADVVLKGGLDAEELRVRLRGLMAKRRQNGGPPRYAGLELDRVRHAVRGPEGSVHLTPREYQILHYLLRRPEQVVRRAVLARAVWWRESEPQSSNRLDVHVSHLRTKLAGAGVPHALHTVRGTGFILAATALPIPQGGSGSVPS